MPLCGHVWHPNGLYPRCNLITVITPTINYVWASPVASCTIWTPTLCPNCSAPNRTNNFWIGGGSTNNRIRLFFDQSELGNDASITVSNSDANLNNSFITRYDRDNFPPEVLVSGSNFIYVTFRAGAQAAPVLRCVRSVLSPTWASRIRASRRLGTAVPVR